MDVADASALALALTDAAAFAVAYPECDISQADVNLDSLIDGNDISAWVDLLL